MPAPNPERLLALLQQFINAPSWGESRRIVEEHPALLTPEADALLGHVLEAYRDDARATRMVTTHRKLLRRCREVGIQAAFADLAGGEADPEARAALEAMEGQMAEDPLFLAFQTLNDARSTNEVLEAVQAHPILLSDEADRMLRQAIENARRMGQAGVAGHIEERHQLLCQIREQGVEPEQLAALAEAREHMAGAVAGLPERLQRVLADVSSPEELEAALEEHPELVEALAQAAGEAGLASGPAEQDPLVQIMHQFISAYAWVDSRHVVQAHPELLSDEADDLLGQMLAEASAQQEENAVRIMEEHRELLRRCREVGIEAAFAEKMSVPAELRPIIDSLGPELGRKFLEIMGEVSSQAELEAALETHPELREALASAAQRTGGGGVEVEIPPAFAADMEELLRIGARMQQEPHLGPQAVAVLEGMLGRPEIERFPEFMAAVLNDLGNAYRNLPTGDPIENVLRAIQCYEEALHIYTLEAAPLDYAMTQNNLGNAYAQLPTGDGGENLARAIQCYEEALRVYTPEVAPLDYAMTQSNLGTTYAELPTGDRGQNLARAIGCFEQALRFRTSEAAPYEYATTQNSLGNAYAQLPTGDPGQNLAWAIACFEEALRVFTPEAAPLDYAMTQNNLGNAYLNLPTGDPIENVLRAIACFEEALRAYTPEAAPHQYSATQNNLGNAYAQLPTGDRGQNLTRAIACYEKALHVYTPEAAPYMYAMTQNNLGNAYLNLPTGDRGQNLTRAIACYEKALHVYTPEAAPIDYAKTQNNLGTTYADLPTGDRRENLARAIACFEEALRVYIPEAAPYMYATTQNNLGTTYAELPTGDRGQNLTRAIACYEKALDVYTPEAAPYEYAATQNNLGNAYQDLPTGDRGQNLARAIACFEEALDVYTPEAAPLDYAMTQNNLGNAYRDLPTGDRGQNLTRAIACYEKAREWYTPEIWPERARDVRRHLGAAHFAAGDWSLAHEAFAVAQALTDELYAAALLREVREQEAGANARMVAQDAFCLMRMGQGEEAWLTLERARARALRQGLDRARARRTLAAAAPEEQDRYEALAAQEQSLRQALGLPEEDPGYRPYHDVHDELASVTKELRSLEHDLLEGAGVELGVSDVAAMREMPLLQKDSDGLLSLALTDHGTVAFLLTSEGLMHTVVEGLTRGKVEALVIQRPDDEDDERGGWLGAYWPQFTLGQARREAAVWATLMPESEAHQRAFQQADAAWEAAHDRWRATMSETLEVLGGRLWPALDGLLREAGVERLMLVPQGVLFLLPLHACPLGDGERVCDRYTVAYAPAGSVLARQGAEAGPREVDDALVVANPTGDLPHTPSEALAIQHALGDGRTLWEGEATEVAVIEAARDAGLIHFSGHGSYDWQAPEQSGLVLPDADGEGFDRLTVAEMREALRLSRTRLVTLSACETGLTEVRRGLADEYIGLPGVLLEAGARAVVASLWAVDDLATALLMGQFYRAWDRGAVPVAQALQAAQKWLRTRTREQVEGALDDLDAQWTLWATQSQDQAMQRRAREQYWEILRARRRLKGMEERPFSHPYWWAGFQAVGDVL